MTITATAMHYPQSQPSQLPSPVPVVISDNLTHDRTFDPCHAEGNLTNRTLRGGTITLAAQGMKFFLRIGSTAALARLLTPADYGLIAMVTVFTGFVEMFKDAGLTRATIQREQITHDQISTLFWVNVGLSCLVMITIAAMAPLLAWFYNEPRLFTITSFLAPTMIFGGIGVQHQALLRRKMQFGRLAIIEILSMLAGMGTAITMASSGYTYWSLIGMASVTSATTAALSCALSGWMPGMPVRGCGIQEMLSFGGRLLASDVLNYNSRNADNFLIGWWWGAASLGAYSKAYGLLLIPIQLISGPVSAVILPVLCRLQLDRDRYRAMYCSAATLVALTTMPICGYVFAAADPLTLFILGDKWNSVAAIFRALAPAAMFGTLNITSSWLATSITSANKQLRWTTVLAILTMFSFCIGLAWGPIGVATSYSLVYCAVRWPGIAYMTTDSPVSAGDIWNAVSRPFFGSVLAALVGLTCDYYLLRQHAPLTRMVLSGLIFIPTFMSVYLVTPNGRIALIAIVAFRQQMQRNVINSQLVRQ